MKQIIMTALTSPYQLIITKIAGIPLVGIYLSWNNKANTAQEISYLPVSVRSYLGTSSSHLISLWFRFPMVRFKSIFQ